MEARQPSLATPRHVRKEAQTQKILFWYQIYRTCTQCQTQECDIEQLEKNVLRLPRLASIYFAEKLCYIAIGVMPS